MTSLFSRGKVAAASTQPAFTRFSTDNVPAALRRDYWMAYAFRAVEACIPTGDSYWHGAVCTGRRGQYVHSVHSPLDTVLTPRRLQAGMSDEHVAICLIHEGEYVVEQIDGRQFRFRAGQLIMFDCGQPMYSHWSRASTSYLRLPRSFVSELLHRDPRSFGRIATVLDDAPLAPFLSSQMTLLGKLGATLAPDALSQVLDMTIDIASVLIQSKLAATADHPVPVPDARLRAARHYIEENLHRHDLTPGKIARALHCSRAQIYRLFDEQSLSVAETVKEARLKRSLRFMRHGDPQVSIGEIADMCGFPDQSTFGKQFRRRFGMTPGEARRSHAKMTADIDTD